MKPGDLIFWHGRNTIALVINIVGVPDPVNSTNPEEYAWYCLLEDGMITHDYLADGYTVIDENWDWPEWHIDHKDNR